MNKRQLKKKLKNESNLATVQQLLDSLRQNFHRELLLIARYTDKNFVDRVKAHYEIADEYSKMRCYHEKEYLKRTTKELETITYRLKIQERHLDFITTVFSIFTIVNIIIFILHFIN